MSQVKCDSGLYGWRGKLRSNYSNFDEFEGYSEVYGLHTRLGFETAEEAWDKNPTLQASVEPGDFRIA